MSASGAAASRGVKRPRGDISDEHSRVPKPSAQAGPAEAMSRHTKLIYSALASHWVRQQGSVSASAGSDETILRIARQLERLLHAAADENSRLRYADMLKRLVCAIQSHPVLTIGLQGGFTTPDTLVETTAGNSIGHLLAVAEAQRQLNLVSPTDEAEAESNPSLSHNLARVRALPALETHLSHILTFLQPSDLAAFGLTTRLFLPIAWSDVVWHALLWRDLGPLQPKYYHWQRGVLSCRRAGNSTFSSFQQPAINLSHLGIANSSRHKELIAYFNAQAPCAQAVTHATGCQSATNTESEPPAGASTPTATTQAQSATSQNGHQQNLQVRSAKLDGGSVCGGDAFAGSYFTVPDSYLRRRGPDDSFRDVYKRAFAYVAHKKAVYESATKLVCENCGQSTALRRMKSQMLRTVQYAECVACRHVWTISVSDGGVKDIIRDMFGSQGIN